MRKYHLVCSLCEATYTDDGARLTCANDHGPALLRSVYAERRFTIGSAATVLRYDTWLPDARAVTTAARTAVYHSTALGSHLGLRQLWIAFSGWWPQRDATLPTGTFKDLEAISVLRRLEPADTRTLVISSAGNTGLAFARACSENDIRALIVVPLRGWHDVLSSAAISDCVRVVAIADVGYEEAIAFAKQICASDAFILEGGVRNIGRRDGMGTAMLAAVEAIGRLPDCYFQAVGSAAGALAAYEAALRVVGDGRFGERVPRLMLSQNAPFSPIHDAWSADSTELLPRAHETAQAQLSQIEAFVLSNQAPPYSASGGVREALRASGGQTYAVSNAQLANAMSLFSELEGIDVEPAAGVTLASLTSAVQRGHVAADEVTLVHITGGGRKGLPSPRAARAQPALIIDRDELATTAIDRARSLVR